MESRFKVDLMPEVFEFLKTLDRKVQQKILSNIERASCLIDPELFKKLNGEIWEFRTLYNNQTYRLFAFWDKQDALVLATHGIVKKTQKIPAKEIKKAERIRSEFFNQKNENRKR